MPRGDQNGVDGIAGGTHATIRRICTAFGLQPHRSETFNLSIDPLFVDKIPNIVGLYLSLPNCPLVLSGDEESQTQALDREQPVLPIIRLSTAGRIVNISSRLGSFTHLTDQEWPPRLINMLGYSSTKAALNMATVSFAIELEDTSIKINVVSPGTLATDLSGVPAAEMAMQPGFDSIEADAALIADYAMLPDDGPTGVFHGPNEIIPW